MRRIENGEVYDTVIALKYSKCEEARFISHIDLLRHISRILLRADIPVRRSNGFNPHALVYFSPPLCLGATSFAEYLTIDTPMAADETMQKFNAAAQKGIRAVKAYQLDKNPNLQARIVAADYIYPYPFRDIDFSHTVISYTKKGEEVSEDASAKILGIQNADGALCVRLATGGVNLRPDRLLKTLEEEYGESASVTDIVKVRQFALEDGEYADVDRLLDKLALLP